MTDALAVHLNRSTHHAIEPASESFETDGGFVVRVQNHGEGSHVHCSISGDLASTATVTDGNPFLEPDEVVEIPVDVRTDLRPARGALEISTGYGRESVEIDVLVREPSNVPTSPVEPERERTSESQSGSIAEADAGVPAAATGSASGVDGDPSRIPTIDAVGERIEATMPRRDAGTALLGGLALLALVIAFGAWQLFDGAAVVLAVLVVLATIVGAAVALVRQ